MNNILLVFEGEKTEKQIVYNLSKHFLTENKTIITCAYCGTVYQVYKQIAEDEDLDTFVLLKEKPANYDTLKSYNRDDFAEIYMFFDYDGHDSAASDFVIEKMLKLFDNETDKGKLYISYPMVEALKHIPDHDDFKDLKVPCKENIFYKNIVDKTAIKTLLKFSKYDNIIWKNIINTHLKKMNFIVNNNNVFPEYIISQYIIFNSQLEKYISVDDTVAVLSAFPVFLHDYYGNISLKQKINVNERH